jgi:hypothetical protein
VRRLSSSCLVVAALAGAGCSVDVDREAYIEHEEKRFDAARPLELHLYTFDGSVEIRSWDRPEVVVDVEKRGQDRAAVSKIQVVADRTGDRIQIEARHPSSSRVTIGFGSFVSPTARLVAMVPKQMNLLVRTGDGAISIERVRGRIELRSGDGSIRATETGGDLLAETRDGTISLDEVAGRVEARTDDGSMRISGVLDGLRARSGDGSIVLRLRRGTRVNEDWLVATGDGSISAELPDDLNAEVEADPGSDGRTRSEFTLVDAKGGTRTERLLRGRLGEGGHLFQLRTGDGTIRLIKY